MDNHNFHKRIIPYNGPNNGFLKKVVAEVEAHYQDEHFGVEALAERLAMSRSHLHRKYKQATGRSINQFIREYRLQRAMELLKQGDLTVSEIAYQVGFGSPGYFSSCFTQHFGYPPGEIRNKLQESGQSGNLLAYFGIKNFPNPGNSRKKVLLSSLIMVCLLITLYVFQLPKVNSNESGINDSVSDKSIAVLPFKNLNPDKKHEYFNKGVVATINTKLSNIKNLKVIPQAIANRYGENQDAVEELAHKLGVTHLLQGSIQRLKDTIKLEVRLINAMTGKPVWMKNYNQEFNDILNIQNDITEKVGLALNDNLFHDEKSTHQTNMSDNPKAYEYYLKGSFGIGSFSKSANLSANDYLKKAVALDPDFTKAYITLAWSYFNKANPIVAEMNVPEAFALAKEPLDKALALSADPRVTYSAKGFYLLHNNWDFEGAEIAYQKSIKDNRPGGIAIYVDLLNFTGRYEEALKLARKNHKMHPLHTNSRMIICLYFNGKYQEAFEFAESRLKITKNYILLHSYGYLLLNTGNYRKAIQIFQQAIDIDGNKNPLILGHLGAAYARLGKEMKARALIEEIKQKNKGPRYFYMAIIYTALNNKDSALDCLQKAYEYHEMPMVKLKCEPQLYSLHDEPEYQELVKKVGFPEYP